MSYPPTKIEVKIESWKRMCKWLESLIFGTGSQTVKAPRQSSAPLEMNEGDYHSGTHGYSPNTPYPETQYGSGNDEDAEWHEEEH